MKRYDAIVLGLGGMGSAALYHLARRGRRVLGVEQFSIGHDRGSSHGTTRLIRKSYFEHPAYVPLVHRAMHLWGELEQEVDRPLFDRTGLILFGRSDGEVITGVRTAAAAHEVRIEEVSLRHAAERWPGFAPDPEMTSLFEPDAGTLAVESCVCAHVDAARAHGAEVLVGERITSFSPAAGAVVVHTERLQFACDRLVVAGGAWSGRLLSALRIPLQVMRKTVMWFEVTDSCHRRDRGCPVYCFDTPDGFFYGFPVIDERGLKLGEHSGGEAMSNPDQLDRSLSHAEARKVNAFVSRYLRGVGSLRAHEVCMYTMTPDQHFVVDHVPHSPQVVFAAGFSGHGFKFAPIIGSVLADLALDGVTKEPIEFLRLSRAALNADG
jgi:sarcosine oxidase